MVTRKQYTKEFKLDAISLVLDQGHTTSEVSQNLEITPNMLRRWIREYQADDADQSFRGNGKLTPEQEEIRQLKAQITVRAACVNLSPANCAKCPSSR